MNTIRIYHAGHLSERAMHWFKKTAGLLLMTLVAGFSVADTLELADGTLMEGDFVGSSNGIVMFNTGGSIEAYPESQVVGIFLSDGVSTAQANATTPEPVSVTVPAGTRLVIRMVDSVDTSRHGVGHTFRGQLERSARRRRHYSSAAGCFPLWNDYCCEAGWSGGRKIGADDGVHRHHGRRSALSDRN